MKETMREEKENEEDEGENKMMIGEDGPRNDEEERRG